MRKHYENAVNFLYNVYKIMAIYVSVSVRVCVHVCVRTYNHIKIHTLKFALIKITYTYVTKFQRYILIYHINMVPVITLMKLSLYKDFIV